MSLQRKFRRRYIAFETSGGMVQKIVEKEVVALARGIGAPGPILKLVYYDDATSQGLMRCGHRQVGEIREKIEVNEKMRTLGVSGTLRAAKRKFLLPR